MEMGTSNMCRPGTSTTLEKSRTTRRNKATEKVPDSNKSSQKRPNSKESTQRKKPKGRVFWRSVTDESHGSVPSLALTHMVRGVDWLRRQRLRTNPAEK